MSVAPSATPSRAGGAEAARINAADELLARDRDAYRAMKLQGVQPPRIDGCHELALGAESEHEVTAGTVLSPAQRQQATSLLADVEAA